MPTKSVTAAKVNWGDFFQEDLDPIPGSYLFEESSPTSGLNMLIVCPCGCGDKFVIPLYKEGDEKSGWLWDGDKDAPTLSPSLFRRSTCGWHGYMRKGIWEWA